MPDSLPVMGLSCYMYKLRDVRLQDSLTERDLVFWVDDKLIISEKCPGSQEGQWCTRGHEAQNHQLGKGEDCPTCSALGQPHLLSCAHFENHNIRMASKYYSMSTGGWPRPWKALTKIFRRIIWSHCPASSQDCVQQPGGSMAGTQRLFCTTSRNS